MFLACYVLRADIETVKSALGWWCSQLTNWVTVTSRWSLSLEACEHYLRKIVVALIQAVTITFWCVDGRVTRHVLYLRVANTVQ